MNLSGVRTSIACAIIQRRVSPISRVAIFLTLTLMAVAVIISAGTTLAFLNLPNILPLVLGVMVLDGISQFAPQTRNILAVQTILYAILYLAITCFAGVLAAYATQRFAFPLQDELFARADTALGVNWFAVAHWTDDHPAIHRILKFAYESMSAQIAMPVVVLAFSNRTSEVREYLLAFALALTVTTIVATLLPATSPIALVDRTAFHVLEFTGATPLDHLAHLREATPVFLSGSPGGIITFPSFHAVIATLTPLALRRYRSVFIILLILDAAMLGGCLTEGAHYFSDVIAGIGIAIGADLFAKRIISAEDRSFAPTAPHVL